MTLTLTPSRSSMGFQVAYCSGNSRCTVMISSPRFHSRPYATTAAPVAPVLTAISSGLAPIIFERDFRIRTGASNHTDSSARMWKLLRFERMLDREDRDARHHRMCRRVQVGCVFNFEPFLLPVGYNLRCHMEKSLFEADVDDVPALHFTSRCKQSICSTDNLRWQNLFRHLHQFHLKIISRVTSVPRNFLISF